MAGVVFFWFFSVKAFCNYHSSVCRLLFLLSVLGKLYFVVGGKDLLLYCCDGRSFIFSCK